MESQAKLHALQSQKSDPLQVAAAELKMRRAELRLAEADEARADEVDSLQAAVEEQERRVISCSVCASFFLVVFQSSPLFWKTCVNTCFSLTCVHLLQVANMRSIPQGHGYQTPRKFVKLSFLLLPRYLTVCCVGGCGPCRNQGCHPWNSSY